MRYWVRVQWRASTQPLAVEIWGSEIWSVGHLMRMGLKVESSDLNVQSLAIVRHTTAGIHFLSSSRLQSIKGPGHPSFQSIRVLQSPSKCAGTIPNLGAPLVRRLLISSSGPTRILDEGF
ncbi:hypothetical protein PM082_017737 [Marasmius tenuissimus]|nr:hypothetical protein PM082_017737 [Marasmius tenuissimus]